ncbi:hypothetical protein [Ruegeria lacuscaerulensis]|uniref:hypothetical protein n=1 Tax=Ruegeria lacuscaerulensis TaxID=55218 RepID=UPI00147CD43B|nr:hypothetical protein [Ruegeria lacuscaerulensis]
MSANLDGGLKDNRDVEYDEGDYSVYPNMDGIKCSMTWKLGSYGERGVLTEGMIGNLCEHYGLPARLVRDLSTILGHCLNNDDDIAINLTEVRRSQAIDRGRKHLNQLFRKAKQSSIAPQELRYALGSLSIYFVSTPEDADLLPQAFTGATAPEPVRTLSLQGRRSGTGFIGSVDPYRGLGDYPGLV